VRRADVERRLFEVLGAWAPQIPEPEVKLFLRVESFRHARHARHAEGAGDGDGDYTAVARSLEELAAGTADTASRLEGVRRLLAAMPGEPDHEASRQEAEGLLANLPAGNVAAEVTEKQ